MEEELSGVIIAPGPMMRDGGETSACLGDSDGYIYISSFRMCWWVSSYIMDVKRSSPTWLDPLAPVEFRWVSCGIRFNYLHYSAYNNILLQKHGISAAVYLISTGKFHFLWWSRAGYRRIILRTEW